MKLRTGGFTLVEILVVVLIISILAGIVGINVLRHPDDAKFKAAGLQIKNLKGAVQLYQMEQNRFPSQQQGLQALCEKPEIPPIPEKYPSGGYLDSRKLPKDPWNRDYIYLIPGRDGENFEIISYGRDGEPGGTGTAADISSSES